MISNLQLRRRLLLALGASGSLLSACSEAHDESTGEHRDSPAGEDAPAEGGSGGVAGFGGASGNPSVATAPGNGGSEGSELAPEDLTVRRPFLVGSRLRSAVAEQRDDWCDPVPVSEERLDDHTRRALAASWLRNALEEHASVAAFGRFSLHLLSIGAPRDLVARSHAAALDEIRHARACFSLARRYGSERQGPGALSLAGAFGPLDLREIVELTVEEGCVGETLGVVLLRGQLRVAVDPAVRAVLLRLLRDEVRHAELAWSFLHWALSIGDAGLRRSALDAFARAEQTAASVVVRPLRADVASWHAHGRLTCSEAKAAAARGIEMVIRPCVDAALAGDGLA
jgi:hypothetical protein